MVPQCVAPPGPSPCGTRQGVAAGAVGAMTSGPSEMQVLEDGGRLELWRSWLGAPEAASLFVLLQRWLPWEQKDIRIKGRTVAQPRLTAWIGDPGVVYTYSGLTHTPHPWPQALFDLRRRLCADTGYDFNSVLANLYRSERDAMGWHADQEKELGKDPVIASVSLGATRRFLLQHRKRKELRLALALEQGSLLLMGGTTQHFWKHAVPREQVATAARINLTFRQVFIPAS